MYRRAYKILKLDCDADIWTWDSHTGWLKIKYSTWQYAISSQLVVTF